MDGTPLKAPHTYCAPDWACHAGLGQSALAHLKGKDSQDVLPEHLLTMPVNKIPALFEQA